MDDYRFVKDIARKVLIEVAQNFKEQGNDYYKGKRYREAMGFYTQGIDANPSDKLLLEALLCNRAACNLELSTLPTFPHICPCSLYLSENYGTVLKDGSRAIQLNIRSSKAYYRSALALIALDRPEEALDCCDRCLAFDKENASVKATRERAEKLVATNVAKEAEKQRKVVEERIKKQRLRSAFEVCGVSVYNHFRNQSSPRNVASS